MMANPGCWYLLRVRLGFESFVASNLHKQRIQVFLPLYHHVATTDARIASPFPGHLFAKFKSDERSVVEKTPGVLCVAGVPKPIPLDEAEMAIVRIAIRSSLPFKVLPVSLDYHHGRVSN